MEAHLGHLTGGVAHDFNNILTVITGAVGILRRNRRRSAAAWSLSRDWIDEAAERGANLTKHLLAFARKQPLRPLETRRQRAGARVRPSFCTPPSANTSKLRRYPGTRMRGPRWSIPVSSTTAVPQSSAECARRDAERRQAHDRDRQHRPRRKLREHAISEAYATAIT